MVVLLRHFLLLIVVLSCWGVLAACKKEKEQAPSPGISAFSPTTGTYSDLVTITGTGFAPEPADNKVTINGQAAAVKSASATQLVVEVPERAGTGPLSVQVTGQPACTSSDFFHYRYVAEVSTLVVGGQNHYSATRGLAADAQGNLFVASSSLTLVQKISPAGVLSAVAGDGNSGHVDGPAASARFSGIAGLAVDAQGNVYVSEWGSHDIRRISPAGVVSTLAGAGGPGYADGSGAAARFNNPEGLAVDAQGNVLVADMGNNCIRLLTPAGQVSTVAGRAAALGGFADGPAGQAQFNSPRGLAVGAKGTIYVADSNNNRIRAVAPDGSVSTLAGSGPCGSTDGPRNAATFYYPFGIALGPDGSLCVTEYNGYRIRLVATDGFVTTLAGAGNACAGTYVPGGFADGLGPTARFNGPAGVAFQAPYVACVADEFNHLIRKITLY